MRITLKIISLLTLALAATTASAVDVGVTVAGQIKPGVYGQVNIGTTPPPLVYAQPVLVMPQPHPVTPIYMNVPPGHAKHWSKHCRKYNACGRPVYFVKTAEYEGGYREDGYRGKHKKDKYDHHDHDHDRGHGHGKGHGKHHRD